MKEDAISDRRGIIRSAPVPLPIPIPPSVMGWMFAEELAWLYGAALGAKNRGVKGGVLEIGCYEGLATCALAQTGTVECVDTWLGGTDRMPTHDSFPAFRANLEGVGLFDRVAAIRGSSRDVLPRLRAEGRRYRLILVDGDHSYEAAKADLEDSWAMLSYGGVLVADDMFVDDAAGVGFKGVRQACQELGGFALLGAGKLGFKIKDPTVLEMR